MIMWKNVFTVLKTNNFSTLTYIPIQFLSPYIHVFYLWEASVFCFTCHNNARAYYSPLHIVVTRISVSGVNEWTSEMMNIQSILYSALLMSWIFYVTTNFKQIIFLCFVPTNSSFLCVWIFFIDYAVTVVPIFPLLSPLHPVPPTL